MTDREPMDIQEAFDALAKSQYQLTTAFQSMSGLLCGIIVGAELVTAKELASFIQAQLD